MRIFTVLLLMCALHGCGPIKTEHTIEPIEIKTDPIGVHRMGDLAAENERLRQELERANDPDEKERAAERKRRKQENAAFVSCWRDDGFHGNVLTLEFKENCMDFRPVNHGDATSSIKWSIPDKWKIILYQDDSYRSPLRVLRGSGEISDLRTWGIGDAISSLRWARF